MKWGRTKTEVMLIKKQTNKKKIVNENISQEFVTWLMYNITQIV